MTDLELMQQALDALEYLATQTRPVYSAEKAVEALRARLTEHEPYAAQAAMVAGQTQGRMYVDAVTGDVGIGTVKSQREWQGLTDEEIMDACSAVWASHPIEVGRVVEEKLKEKNT